MPETVNTRKVSNRRKLKYETPSDCIADVERIMAADRQGSLQALGNWTPGQNLSHVAAWIEYADAGYPIKPAIWPIRTLIRLILPYMLRRELKPGVSIPGVPGGTTGADDIPVSQAGPRLIRAMKRLESNEPLRFPHPAFGKVPLEMFRQANLNHAAMHLSFLQFE